MYLSEFFDQLTYGELAGLAIGGIDSGGIQPANYPRIINNINSGLIELYTLFPLKASEIFIQLYEHISLYVLHSDYAETNVASTKPYKYILDSTDFPFTNDLLVIDNVFSESGDEYPLNESDEDFSVFTPSYNTLQVPFSADENTISVVYRAAPILLPTTGVTPTTIDVPIPYSLLSCLVAYVLHKIHSSIGSGEGNQAGIYYNKYKELVAIARNEGMLNTDTNLNRRLNNAGWV